MDEYNKNISRSIILQKRNIRRLMADIRERISVSKRKKLDERIASLLITHPICMRAKMVCIYVSLPDEVDTKRIIKELFRQKKTVVVPKIIHKELGLFKIKSCNDLAQGPYAILEPCEYCPAVDSSSVDVFIVPGIAFDRQGFRLGRGEGYYDRLLKNTKATKIGLLYSYQLIPGLPHGEYDIPMDILITENKTLTIVNSK